MHSNNDFDSEALWSLDLNKLKFYEIPYADPDISQDTTASTSNKTTKEETVEEPTGALMEGLARQALLAARVFHLIPVEKARERLPYNKIIKIAFVEGTVV